MLARRDGIPFVNSSSFVAPSQEVTSAAPRALPAAGWQHRATAANAIALRYEPSAVTRSQRLRAIAQLDATARALAVAARRRNGTDPVPAHTR
jgi:hypothetical protein